MKKCFLLCAAALLSAGLHARSGSAGQPLAAASAAASSISINVAGSGYQTGHVGYDGGTVEIEVTCNSSWTVDIYGVYMYTDGRPNVTVTSPDWALIDGRQGPSFGNGNQTVRVYIAKEVVGVIDHLRHAELVFRNQATGETCTAYINQGL